MIRSLSDVLTSKQNQADIINILKNPDLEKEKFILGLKWVNNFFFCFNFIFLRLICRLIYNSDRVDNGFTLLKSIKQLNTSVVFEPSFVEELLNSSSLYQTNFGNTLKILYIILKNASHKGKKGRLSSNFFVSSSTFIYSQINSKWRFTRTCCNTRRKKLMFQISTMS